MFSMAMDVEAEIRDRKRRVSELEGSFGFMTEQVKNVHKDLLAFQAETERRFERVDQRFDRVESRLEGEIRGLRTDMPSIVGDAMREVLREGGDKPRK